MPLENFNPPESPDDDRLLLFPIKLQGMETLNSTDVSTRLYMPAPANKTQRWIGKIIPFKNYFPDIAYNEMDYLNFHAYMTTSFSRVSDCLPRNTNLPALRKNEDTHYFLLEVVWSYVGILCRSCLRR